MGDLREKIAEIIFQGSPYIGMSLVGVKNASKEVADKILKEINKPENMEVECPHYWFDKEGHESGCRLDTMQECPYENGNTINDDTQWQCHTKGYITKTLKEREE